VTSVDKDQAKHAVRERVWALLEQERAVLPGVHGRIPAFFGAEAAADRLATLPAWQMARIIKAVPDKGAAARSGTGAH
jgi:5-formyltetrahydrofolate cyclo-ligase